MWTIYMNMIIACLTVVLAYLHKRLSERAMPTRELHRDDETSEKSNVKIDA